MIDSTRIHPWLAPHVAVSETPRPRGDRRGGVEHWKMGDDTWLMSAEYHGLAAQSKADPRADPSTRMITLAVVTAGDWTLIREGATESAHGDHPTLVALDQSTAFDFRGHGIGSMIAMHVGQARLTLSIETIRRAIGILGAELPLYPLAQSHLRQLGAVAAGSASYLPELSTTSVALMRSLLVSAADNDRTVGPADGTVATIERYIGDHIDDPDLCADAIASAHHMSTRQLYKLWPTRHGGIAGYIAARKLEQARESLVAQPHLSIAAVARRHGFADPTHFTHRFQHEFGMSPSQWRRQA